MAMSKRWVFTLNNYAMEECEVVQTWGTYGKCQREVGANGTHHLQGFVVFASNQRLSAVRKLPSGVRAHWEIMAGTLEQSEAYCTKDESRLEGTEPWSWGIRPTAKQGARTDIAHVIEAMRAAGGGVRSRMDAAVDGDATVVAKYARGLEAVAESMVRRAVKPLAAPVWRPWQAALAAKLLEEPDDRHILWYYDHHGGQGKSTFIRHMLRSDPAHNRMLAGRVVDMAYMFEEGTRVVFFDITRSQAENMSHLYSFAESLKNGQVISTKYTSTMKLFDPPHVVFFANVPPPPAGTVWSADRVILTTLGAPAVPLTF